MMIEHLILQQLCDLCMCTYLTTEKQIIFKISLMLALIENVKLKMYFYLILFLRYATL